MYLLSVRLLRKELVNNSDLLLKVGLIVSVKKVTGVYQYVAMRNVNDVMLTVGIGNVNDSKNRPLTVAKTTNFTQSHCMFFLQFYDLYLYSTIDSGYSFTLNSGRLLRARV
jgi:hypothetical protein